MLDNGETASDSRANFDGGQVTSGAFVRSRPF